MSQGKDDTVVMGRVLMNCSISHNKVMKVSSVRALDPMMVYTEFLTIQMRRSQSPSKCAVWAGLNFQDI